jgi:alpha-ketoglutarate-dependent taurine dioxygenase
MPAVTAVEAGNPFDLADDRAYRAWRDRKLAAHPSRIEDLVVEVRDPRRLTAGEHAALLDRCRRANMVLYASRCGADPDKDIPRLLGRQFGLERLDANLLADDDGITPLAVAESGGRASFIPYTNRPIRWHTDGYYNPPERNIRGMVLHCVTPAASGGDNALLDHEMAYLLLRDANPDFIRALSAPDAMTIPPRTDEDGIARPEQSGPVFSVDPATGALHMRYTHRTHSIAWKADAATLAAVDALKTLLGSGSPFIFHGRMESGMGLLCNNVLHDRSAFTETPSQRRLLYRARYYDRIAGT